MTERYDHALGQASGLSLDGCSCLARRWELDAPFRLDSGESHVFETEGEAVSTEMPTPGRYSGVWRSASDAVYVCHQGGLILSRSNPHAEWRSFEYEGVLSGIWGLDGHDLVFAWGLAPGGKQHVMLLRNADGTWSETAAPDQRVLGMHGVHPGLIFAVGSGGSISRWDNGRWAAMTSPVTGDLGSIFVVDETEIYACGTGNGYILEGSLDGWKRRGPFDFPLHRVAKHSGHLWVGTGLSGLQRLNPGATTLEHVKPLVQAFHLDARGDLLISGRDGIVATQDGLDFFEQPIDAYVDLAGDNAPTWIR